MLRSRLFTTATSLDLSGIITDETGTGSLVFSISPTIITPTFTNLSTFNGQVNITDATASITTSTGALVVLGGLGIGGAANIGGITKVTNNTATSNTTTGAFVVTGGVGIGGGLYAGGQVNLTATADSTDKDSGALVVEGGVGIEKNLYVGGNVNITGSVTIPNDSITYAKIQNVSATDKILGRSSAGAGDIEEITCTAAGRALLDDANATDQLTTLGAAADSVVVKLSGDQTVAGAKTFSGITTVSNTTESTTKDTGALVVEGGVGIEKRLNVGGNAVINSIHVGTGTAAAPTSNTVVGNGAGAALQSGGTNNTLIGSTAGDAITTGDNNIAVGVNALGANLTGSNQVAVGTGALQFADGGTSNTAVGHASGSSITSGTDNAFFGYFSGSGGQQSQTTSLGHGTSATWGPSYSALTSVTNGVYIGWNTNPSAATEHNAICIGHRVLSNGSNTTTLGNSATTGTYLAGRVYPGNNTGLGTPGIFFVGTNGNNGGIVGNVVTTDVSSSFIVRNSTGTSNFLSVSASTGDTTLANGNLVIGTAGKGISFAATSDPTIPAVAATGTITGTATNVANNDTVTLGAQAYTFKTTLTPADYEVLIGADAAGSLTNLRNAILGTGGSPGDYQVPGAHPTVTADAIVGSVIPVTALTAGTAGNSIALAETSAELSVSAATLEGGRAAQGMTGEILNDYEEGTWSPVYESTSGSFAAMAMNVTNATYTKIGRAVTVTAQISTNNVSVGGASGNLRIAGLPYAAGSSAGANISQLQLWTVTPINGSIAASATTISLIKRNTSNGADTPSVVADINATTINGYNILFLSATYFT